ncbi:hypothetical protein GCM10022631_31030 [Deinococcus rubellus]|uniref:PEGA domain-containing protein n=1 Tax=Deinococcus rubellus TaxID=1889240 RepID=A0ABY5YES3_9DEIO|nr:PEGA domain-containing protein [Deinococcus rubellus]UWX63446.1 PEGA domain-containing protein [Deinococcus rubellus]
MKRRPLMTACLLTLPALLSACLPAPLRSQSGSSLTLTAQLDDTLKVAEGEYRRPGPAQLRVQASGASPETYLYALVLPDQAHPSAAARLLMPTPQPLPGGQTATFDLPPASGFTQVFVVGSPRTLMFPALGSNVGQLSEALKAATAGLPAASWNVTTQVYRAGDYGQLRVLSEPSGANVYLGGNYRGRTPLTLSAVPAGNLALRLELQNYAPLTRTVTVRPDQLAEVKVGLRPQPAVGHLNVQSTLPAQVQALGSLKEVRGPAPLSADLPAGDYALTLTPLGSPLKAAWLGLSVARNQTVNVWCAPEGERLSCQIQ